MWIVVDSLIDPSTGTVFTWTTSTNKMNMIIWHSEEIQLLPGDKITMSTGGFSKISEQTKHTIYHTTPFRPSFWSLLMSNLNCPKNNKKFVYCPISCYIKSCEYK